MSETRANKLAEIIKEEVCDILATRLKDPRVGFTTVTNVEVTRDLSQGKIYVSVLGTAEEVTETFSTLEKATGFVRSELAGRIRVRHVPELQFILDQALEHSMHINQLLRELNMENEDDEERK